MTRAALAIVLLATMAGDTPAAGTGTGTVKGTITTAAGPRADAVVLIDAPPAPPPPGAPHATMDQRKETFVPHVLAVAAGTTVDFPNHDSVLHNVSAASPAKTFDLGMYPAGTVRSVTFDRPGVVAIRCNVHPRMSAWVVVHTNPWSAVTDARGRFTIAGVPPGTYPVRVWHEDLGERAATVTVHQDAVQALDMRLERGR
jgi:plastocyanin